MDEWESLTSAEKEQVLRANLRRMEQKILEYSAQIAEAYQHFARLRDDLEQISIFGADDFFSAGRYEKTSLSYPNYGIIF